jgi:hypothetical protein
MVTLTRFRGLLLTLAIARPALAQFPPPPQDLTVLKSKFNPEITISYKEACTHALYRVKKPVF